MAATERDALAAKHFPDLWAKIEHYPGKSKARQKLRRAAEIEEQIEALKARGKSCAGCRSYLPPPIGLKNHICDAQSDFHGYVETTPDDVCILWHATQQDEGGRG